MKVKRFVFNSFQENTYVIYNEVGDCIIVDPGCSNDKENDELATFIKENELKPIHLIVTHGHIDHILGTAFVINKYNIPLEVHPDDEIFIKSAPSFASNYGFEINMPTQIEAILTENSDIKLGNSSLKILHVPGHSPGHIALYSAQDKFVIVGDVLFKGSIGRTDLPGGDYDILMKSIGTKLMTLDEDVVVYCGHMEETTIGIEKRSNPFITEYYGTF